MWFQSLALPRHFTLLVNRLHLLSQMKTLLLKIVNAREDTDPKCCDDTISPLRPVQLSPPSLVQDPLTTLVQVFSARYTALRRGEPIGHRGSPEAAQNPLTSLAVARFNIQSYGSAKAKLVDMANGPGSLHQRFRN